MQFLVEAGDTERRISEAAQSDFIAHQQVVQRAMDGAEKGT